MVKKLGYILLILAYIMLGILMSVTWGKQPKEHPLSPSKEYIKNQKKSKHEL